MYNKKNDLAQDAPLMAQVSSTLAKGCMMDSMLDDCVCVI